MKKGFKENIEKLTLENNSLGRSGINKAALRYYIKQVFEFDSK